MEGVRTQLSGLLDATPVNPTTGQPTGPTVQAFVFENHRGMLTDNHAEVTWSLGRTIYGDITQMLSTSFSAGQHDAFTTNEDCGAAVP